MKECVRLMQDWSAIYRSWRLSELTEVDAAGGTGSVQGNEGGAGKSEAEEGEGEGRKEKSDRGSCSLSPDPTGF